MLNFIKQIEKINDDFSVVSLFNNNERRLVDLSDWVTEFKKANDGWASRISDINYFKTVHLDSYGTLQWNNQLDFCPDVLYEISKPA
jgi:Protein of unknown function (DUF2442)